MIKGKKVTSTMNNHIIKQHHIAPLCFLYDANDNSITGFVPHLNLTMH